MTGNNPVIDIVETRQSDCSMGVGKTRCHPNVPYHQSQYCEQREREKASDESIVP